MTTIFISYRRSDDPYAARSINDALCAKFGKGNVYFDLDALQAGLDWRKQIDSMVAECDVMLVIIGDRWLQPDESGRSRLEDEDDLVRLEVASALRRDIPVIPVLVGKAAIPSKESLPEDLSSLIYRQAVEVRATANFATQIQRLLRSIRALTPDDVAEEEQPPTPPIKSRLKPMIWLLIVTPIAVVLAVGLAWKPLMQLVFEGSEPVSTSENAVETVPTPELPATFQMPNVVGLSVSEAERRVLLAGREKRASSARAVIVGRESHARPAGQIIRQLEPPNTQMRPYMDDDGGTHGQVTFRVVVSTGPESAPNFVGRSLGSAARLARQTEVVLEVGPGQEDPRVPKGYIVRQDPPAGQPIPREGVTVYPSAGYPLPDYVGQPLHDARSDSQRFRFNLAEQSEYNPDFPKWTIIEQSPPAGTPLPLRSPVSVKYSLGTQKAEQEENKRQPEPVGQTEFVAGQVFKDCDVCPEMVVIPAGSFVMGGSKENEQPQHRVNVPKFAMSKYEVTFDEYDAFAQETGRELPKDERWGRGSRPVIHVSWEDAKAHAIWLSEQTGMQYRLPSEAEWEYATRAGTKTAYWWGDDIDKDGKVWANCRECGEHEFSRQTAPVGSFEANQFGLYDTAGNVWEWVEDCWHRDYENAPDDGSASLMADGGVCDLRVIRGGSWHKLPKTLLSANRSNTGPNANPDDLGFRLALDLD